VLGQRVALGELFERLLSAPQPQLVAA